jgi:hypothetical protein
VTQPPYYQPSHTDRNIVIAVVIILVVVVAAIAVVGSIFFFTAVNRSSILSQIHTTNIVNGLITVRAGGYNYYEFIVPAGATSIHVGGTFTATGGSGNDVEVYIMDKTNFVNWSNGHQATANYNSGQLTTSSFDVILGPGTTYDLVYSNTFSTFTSKNVQTTADLIYTL